MKGIESHWRYRWRYYCLRCWTRGTRIISIRIRKCWGLQLIVDRSRYCWKAVVVYIKLIEINFLFCNVPYSIKSNYTNIHIGGVYHHYLDQCYSRIQIDSSVSSLEGNQLSFLCHFHWIDKILKISSKISPPKVVDDGDWLDLWKCCFEVGLR